MSTFVFISFLLANALSTVSSTLPSQPEHIFLLAGQSNMVGRGGVHEEAGQRFVWNGIVPEEFKSNDSIMRLDVDMNWVKAEEPIHAAIYKIQPATGLGPEMPFAKGILERNPSYGTIGLVPCSSISRWQRGRYVYGNLTARAEAAVKNGGKIEALLWWQGGADSDNINKAHKYKEDLTKFFQDIRADLKLPELLIIQVVILPGRKPFASIVREAQLSLNVPNVENVDPHVLPLEADGIHGTAQA
ncbi:probable carbohydrate esterase At4g34215 [Punica granatum]|uniref:Sialate O-acetylesterase domain-containing protein n=2 Tax=Punica granatum TaxID=22663 RepID=A0A218WKI4_PUNGR|nr:probable carbohydrate esterase At4g34215 [Punica granatum]OWM73156.1 hypothetical protein CDL15_Pgr001270 [Punica granatum]PKI31848.1 hypothetical protein CRG98_047761 [Punica granatum]